MEALSLPAMGALHMGRQAAPGVNQGAVMGEGDRLCARRRTALRAHPRRGEAQTHRGGYRGRCCRCLYCRQAQPADEALDIEEEGAVVREGADLVVPC